MPNLTPEKLAEIVQRWENADDEDRDDVLQDLMVAVYPEEAGQNQ